MQLNYHNVAQSAKYIFKEFPTNNIKKALHHTGLQKGL